MGRFLIILLTLITLNSYGQLGKYSLDVTPQETFESGIKVRYCAKVDNYTPCSLEWFNALEIDLQGATLFKYRDRPSNRWKKANEIIDEPPGWLGWVYDYGGSSVIAWGDWGDVTANTNPKEFCFVVKTTSPTYSVSVNVWSDYDTRAYNRGCGIRGNPDGPHLLSSNALPITLVSFNVTCDEVTWVTSSEINNDYFVIETSYDANYWTTLVTVGGQGNSSQITSYTYRLSNNDVSQYYRLRQVDFDGKEETFKYLYTECGDGIDVYLTHIYDIMGNLIYISVNKNITPNLDRLEGGIYFHRYSNGEVRKVFH